MRQFNAEPKKIAPLAANLALGGMAAYFATKYRGARRRIQHAQKVEKHLMYQATHDALTGELNKRGIEAVLASNKPPRAMLYADSTNLKSVNDEHGHGRGDEAIVATAQVLRESLRPDDIIARTGGDEFLVLLDPERREHPGTSSPEELLTHTTSRISEKTHDLLALPENADLARVGFDIAVGGAVWERGMTIDNLRDAADAAMYTAKGVQHANGRSDLPR